jgi:hypothetical protein
MGKMIKGVTLPENYIRALRQRRMNLSQIVEIGWGNRMRQSPQDWPRLTRGATKRHTTTVTLTPTVAQGVMAAEQGPGRLNFSAWVEQLLQQAYPHIFLAGGQVRWF